MKAIETLEREHSNLLVALELVERKCINMMNGEIDVKFVKDGVKFIRTYADKHHHGKEEEILFKYMEEELGAIGQKLVRNGMLVEHDMGRFYMYEIDEALKNYIKVPSDQYKLKILTNLMSYVYLIRRHIEKENAVIYPYGIKNLSEDILEKIEKESEEFEEKYLAAVREENLEFFQLLGL